MQLPQEILLHILKHLVATLSFDALPLRLVNTPFADEIPKLLFRSPTRLENDFTLKRWSNFPSRFQRLYLRSKIDMHDATPCVFSFFARELLKTELARRSKSLSSPVPFVDRIVDIAPYMGNDRWDMFDPARYDIYMTWYPKQLESRSPCRVIWEPSEDTALQVLAESAIFRNEANILSWTLYSGLDMAQRSGRLEMSPIWFAAKKASKEIAALIVARGYDLSSRRHFGKLYNVLVDAAVGSNTAALEVWIEYLKGKKDEHLQFNVRRMIHISVMRRDFTMMDFLTPWCEGNVAAFLYDILIEAVHSDRTAQIKGLLEYKAFDRAIWTTKYPKGPIFTIMWNPGYRPMDVLEALLQGGIDPDGRYPGVVGTPLQRAVEESRLDVAEILIRFGADVNSSCVPHRMRKRSKVPLLLIAARKKNYRMVRLLLDNGADPTSVLQDEKHGTYVRRVMDGLELKQQDFTISGEKTFKQ